MFYGAMFYFDQPVKRLWFRVTNEPGLAFLDGLYAIGKNAPTLIPNEIYKLYHGEYRHTPKVQVVSEKAFDTVLSAEIHVNDLLINEIEGMIKQGIFPDDIRNTIINIDEVTREIRMLRSAITVNAGLYYDHNVTAIKDDVWDGMAQRLCTLQKMHAYALPYVNFFDKEFADFDPSTGFHLPYRSEPFYSTTLRALEYLAQRK